MVVSNTSPLMNLAIIGRLELLHQLFGNIYIPDEVWNELVINGKSKPGSKQIRTAKWIHTRTVQNRHLVTALQQQLDSGEAEAITLALELKATLILLDESEGRRMTSLYGLRKTGVLGILLLAKNMKLIPSIKNELDRLESIAHFWIHPQLYQKLLQAAGE